MLSRTKFLEFVDSPSFWNGFLDKNLSFPNSFLNDKGMLVSNSNADRNLKITGVFSLSSFINKTSSFILRLKILSIKLYTSSEGTTYKHTGEGLARQQKKNLLCLLAVYQRVYQYVEQLHISLEKRFSKISFRSQDL